MCKWCPMTGLAIIEGPRIPRSCDPDWRFRDESGNYTEEWYRGQHYYRMEWAKRYLQHGTELIKRAYADDD